MITIVVKGREVSSLYRRNIERHRKINDNDNENDFYIQQCLYTKIVNQQFRKYGKARSHRLISLLSLLNQCHLQK